MIDLNPLVSIIIPVYNGSDYLKEAIDSALGQTYKNIEIIVINDGSNDQGKTEQIALSYSDKIKYFTKENAGVASALNLGIKKMAGDYFSWLSHDDLYKPDKIKLQIEALKEYGQEAVVYCDFEHIDSNGRSLKKFKVYEKASNNIKALLAIGMRNPLNGCSLLIPKKFFTKYGCFDTALRTTQDYDMWSRLAKKERFIPVKKSLVLSRQHEAQDSKKKAELCNIESDLLHSKLINELTPQEAENYSENSVEFLINAYKSYTLANFTKIPASLMKLLSKTTSFSKTNHAIVFFNEYIFRFKNKTLCANELAKINSFKKEKKRILFFNDVWIFGGVERVLSVVLSELADKYDVILASCFESEGIMLPNAIKTVAIGQSREDLGIRAANLAFLLEADLFIGNCNIIPSFFKAYTILSALEIKTIAANHYYYFLPYFHPSLKGILPFRTTALSQTDASIWSTSYSAAIYSYIQDNGVLIHNPLSFEKEETPSLEKNTILCVGRFNDTIKRLDKLLEVFSLILKKQPDAKLIIAGPYDLHMKFPPDYKETIKETLLRLDIEKNVTFAGEQKEILPFYKKSSILLMTSENEGFGMVLTEAGHCGLPCIVFHFPGCEDIIHDGKNGFIVPQNDISGMAEKASLLLTNKALRKEMSKSAVTLSSRFNRKNISQRWINLIENVLSDRKLSGLNNALKQELTPVDSYDTLNISHEFNNAFARLLTENNPPPITSLVKKEETIYFQEALTQEYENFTNKQKEYFAEKLDQEILLTGSKKETAEIIESLAQLRTNGKPTLLFHLYGWLKGGAERAITNLTSHLALSYNIIIAAFAPFQNNEYKLHKDIIFIKLNHENIDRLVKLVKFIRPSVFIGSNNSIPDFVKIYPKLKNSKIKTIAWCHEYFFFMHHHKELHRYAHIKQRFLKEVDAVIYPSKFSAYASNTLKNNATYIPNPNTYTSEFKRKNKLTGLRIMSTGRFNDPIKRLDKLLIVFKKVLQLHPDAILTIVGPYDSNMPLPDNEGQTISDLLKELNIPKDNLRFEGFSSKPEKFYKENDIFIMTSDNEGFGMVLTEAGQFGLILFAFEFPGIEDIITDGENGFIIKNHDDTEAMAFKISELINNPDKINSLSLTSTLLANRFTLEEVGSKWENIITRIIAGDNLDISMELPIEQNRCYKKIIASEYEKAAAFAVCEEESSGNPVQGILRGLNKFGLSFIIHTTLSNLKHYGLKDTINKIVANIKKR